VFPDSESADEEILLLNVRRQARHSTAYTTAVDTNFSTDQQLATVTICQRVQQCRLPRPTVHIRLSIISPSAAATTSVLSGWWPGLAVTRWSRSTYSYSTSGPVNTWMGDRLRVGKSFRYVTSHYSVCQLSLPSLRGR